MGEKINAVINVTANTKPDHVCTYESDKFPIPAIYKEIKGITIVILPLIKKLANHMIAKFRFNTLFVSIVSTLLSTKCFAPLNIPYSEVNLKYLAQECINMSKIGLS